MSDGATVSQCRNCGWTGMPPRDWCPVCARDCVGDARVPFGLVEQATTVRRGVGPSRSTVRLGSIRLDGGGVVLARLDPGLPRVSVRVSRTTTRRSSRVRFDLHVSARETQVPERMRATEGGGRPAIAVSERRPSRDPRQCQRHRAHVERTCEPFRSP